MHEATQATHAEKQIAAMMNQIFGNSYTNNKQEIGPCVVSRQKQQRK